MSALPCTSDAFATVASLFHVHSMGGDAPAPARSRCFGFFPMSRYLIVDAEPTTMGMVDGVAHRSEHAPIYRTYSYTGPDSLYEEAREDQILLLRGLFMTSFLVDDMIGDKDFYGAEAGIVTSASSKTSIALGHQLARRGRGASGTPRRSRCMRGSRPSSSRPPPRRLLRALG